MTDDCPLKPDLSYLVGTAEENLAAHPVVEVSELRRVPELELPVWVELDPSEVSRQTHHHLTWEVEPFGEYLYFYAGDFLKNEKGLLRFRTAETVAEVFVSYEPDAIDVAGLDCAALVDQAASSGLTHFDLADLTVREAQLYPFAALPGAPGLSYIEVFPFPPLNRPVQLITVIIDRTLERPRLTQIRVRSQNGDAEMADLIDLHFDLAERYAAIPDHPLCGAIRM